MGRFFKKQVIYGRGEHASPYLVRYRLFNVALHVFYRGDPDPDPHDHPFDFKTFPLAPYVEEVYIPDTGAKYTQVVPAFRWTKRKAEHCHRILGRYSGLDEYTGYDRPQVDAEVFFTIVVFKPRRREWGFYKNRVWIQWRRYLSNIDPTTWVD